MWAYRNEERAEMAKQPKRPTRKQKIEAAKLAKIEEAQKLKTAAASLRPQRDFIGQKKEQAE
jgi:hypothetical protein